MEAVGLQHSFLPAHLLLAGIALRAGRPKEAEAETNEVLKLQPGNIHATLLRAITEVSLGNLRDARIELNQLIKEHPQYSEANLQLALLNVTEKKYDDAERILEKLYQPGQADTRVLESHIRVLVARKQGEAALKLINEDLLKSQKRGRIRLLLARTALAIDRPDIGIEQLQLLLKEEPKSLEGHLRLADSLTREGRFDEALSVLQKANKLAPNDVATTFLFASAQDRVGQKVEAIVNYRHALALQPDNPAVMNNLAYVLSETGGNLDEALTLARRALTKVQGAPDFSDTLGCIYLKKKMHDSAIQIFSSLVRKNPENATFHYHLGETLIGKGEREKARDVLKTALSKRPAKDVEIRIREALASLG